jgi:hypothetical protein
VYDVNPFQSDGWLSRYFQYKKWSGPHQFPLSFDSESMKITGSGSDDVGVLPIDGTYSTETNQIDTGDCKQNLGHQVVIRLTWNAQSHQFEGIWHVQINAHHDAGTFHLKFYATYIKSKLLSTFQECLVIFLNVLRS